MSPPSKVVVVGLGKSGAGAVRLLQRQGAQVTVADDKPAHELSLPAGVALAPMSARFWEGVDRVVVSPGVPLSHPSLVAARAAGVEVIGEIELAWQALAPRSFAGITGTNGKSTTTALAGEIFRHQHPDVFVGGNLGTPLSDAALEPSRYGPCVVELSSFQLEGIAKARFQAAAILNLTPDHIDRYPSQQAYGEAKARIFLNQQPEDTLVVNADDAPVRELSRAARSQVWGFSMKEPVGLDGAMPLGEGFVLRFGCLVHEFRLRNPALRGGHNVQNAMAAALLAFALRIPPEKIQAGLDSYPGLPHRLESVRTLAGVEWVNDSKATNVDSTLVALAAFRRGVWLIAGGKGKGAPYLPMVDASRGKVNGVLTIGQDAPTIEGAYRGVAAVYPCGTLGEAVRRARELAGEGDTVLLSPACASYDQFKNFEDRGDQFKRMVKELK
jgi:UDP-N-acetylmuramoylalanine--D-glutamate ligase